MLAPTKGEKISKKHRDVREEDIGFFRSLENAFGDFFEDAEREEILEGRRQVVVGFQQLYSLSCSAGLHCPAWKNLDLKRYTAKIKGIYGLAKQENSAILDSPALKKISVYVATLCGTRNKPFSGKFRMPSWMFRAIDEAWNAECERGGGRQH